jgi:hypothetical protein
MTRLALIAKTARTHGTCRKPWSGSAFSGYAVVRSQEADQRPGTMAVTPVEAVGS